MARSTIEAEAACRAELAVLDRVEHGRRRGSVDIGLLEEAELLFLRQYPAARSIESVQRHGTRAHQRGQVPVAPVRGELHVEAGQQGETGGVHFVSGAVVEVLQAADPEVVGDRDAGEAQFVTEQLGQELGRSVKGQAVDLVVRRHDRSDAGLVDHGGNGRQ